MALSLMILVDRKLAEQCHRDWVGLVALLRLGQECSFDLRGAQGYVTDDFRRGGVADDIGA
jgi:hypothetical protein